MDTLLIVILVAAFTGLVASVIALYNTLHSGKRKNNWIKAH
ncbi:hypothetical protein SAMN05444280_11669 [Tangfeifania diversioriginum]|uniref:Uncharacterized protein n=1 Tax=Tangfeifania diversioriginum TaxID=1168035 RepID=A0A1M6IE71_9BACT|nr:hypothetical protein [Tangfeifania diversioriginum]SHJ32748.1 hypothetical protein SAMN05444280_11669 [Tangfeifania diversioriginum]